MGRNRIVRAGIVGAFVLTALLAALPAAADEPAKLSVLMLGDDGHHRPADLAKIITPVLAKDSIDVTYVQEVDDALTPERLAKYDALLIFRDHGDLPPKAEAALLDFVEGGKGLFALHCASNCFRNSDKYTALVGGRFLRHDTGTFRARIIDAQHPAMRGLSSFESWDETYVHDQLGKDIRVLMVREEQGGYEPYTWVRDQGKGRVFYTALGHDEHTWKAEGFQKLLEQGLRWCGGKVPEDKDVKPFEYVDANVPFYPPGEKWGTTSDQATRKMQLPLDPEQSMKHMHLPEGFEVQLFASDPDIYRPICMAWDARGRLWIAETVDYPNDKQPPGQGHDRIVILEDTKGTGKADKFTVFAEGLSIPTSMTFARGGVIVTQAPETLFLKDTDGDDKADVRETLFRGWGVQDTHAGPSNIRYAFDNNIYGTVGYSGFNGTIGGKDFRFSQGVWRMKPDGTDFEFLTSTSNNTWGLGLSETGEVFASTANNQHSVFLGVPNRYFEAVRGWHGLGSAGIEDHKKFHPVTDKIRQVDFHGGFTAAAGHALYTARSFPEEYWNKAAFVCEPTGHLVHTDWLVPKGSGFVARDGWNILASDDEWTAPICAEVGPDGALWVIDWYNYIVQHNPTPKGFETGKGAAYVTPLRDKTHGRIYRIVYKGAKPSPKVDFTKADEKELVATLSQENMWTRTTAQRLLVERGKTDVVPQLAAVVKDAKSPAGAFHALWTMHGLGAFAADKGDAFDAAKAGLASADPGVRRAALAVMPRTADGAAAILAAKSIANPDATVRQEALLALSEMPASKEAAAAVMAGVLDPKNAGDPWIPSALVAAAARSDMEFLLAAMAAKPAKEVESTYTKTIRVVAEHLARQAPDGAAPKLLAALQSAEPMSAEPLLAGLAAGWPRTRKPVLDDAASADFSALAAKLPPSGVTQLAQLAKRWGQEKLMGATTGKLRDAALKRVADDKLPDDARLAAAHDLISLGGDEESLKAVLDQIGPQAGPTLTAGFFDALADSSSEAVGPAVVKHWPQLTPAGRGAAVDLLLKRPAWASALLDAVEKGGVDKADLGVEQTQRLSRYPDASVSDRARKLLASSGGLPNPDRQKVVDAFLPALKRRGDAIHGRKVFEDNCAKCHRHGDLGANIGPDLTGMAVRDRADLAIDVLDPNRSVEGNYRQYIIQTKDGRVLQGLLLSETQTTVELMDSQAKKHDVLREDIDEFRATKLSLMPDGFEKLGDDDLLCVLEFLTAHDKFFPLPLGKAATIASVKGMFISKDADEQRLIFPKWGPQTAFGVPFQVIDPRDGAVPNVIELYGPLGEVSKTLPKSATIPCNSPAKAIHLLSGVGGWCFPYSKKGTTSMIVRLHYADGKTEDHALINGVHMADYIRVVDVPESQLAFKLRGQQIRYLSIKPDGTDKIDTIEFIKGDDDTAPVVMAATVESLQ
jgi:putative membrane-bound dehydrogenase-like protein